MIFLNPRRLWAVPVFLFSILTAQAADIPPWAHQASDLEPDPAVTFGQLSNGMRYIIMPWNEPPDRISMRLVVEAGSLHETDAQKGLAHFIEHMAFNGTRHFSSGEMVEYFQRLGMAFGPDTNAHTWWRETVYKLELPENSPELVDDALLLMRDYADGMLFPAEEIERERGVILSEKRDRDSAQLRAFISQLEFNMPDSLVPERLTIGDEDILSTAPRAELVDYYEKWYTVDRMVFIAVGAVDPDAFASELEKHFASMEAPAERRADPDLGSVGGRGRLSKVYSDPELPQTEVEISTVEQIEATPDTLERRRERLALSVANSIFDRRIEKLLKEEGIPISGGGAYAYDWLDFARFAGVTAQTKAEQWQEAMRLIGIELRRVLEHGFTNVELQEIVAQRRNAYELAVQKAPTRKSRDLSSAIVRSVIDGEVFTSPEQELALMQPALEEMTPEEAHEAFRAVWAPEDRFLWVMGDLGKNVNSIYDEVLAAEVEAPEAEQAVEFAYTDFGQPAEIVSDTYLEDLAVRRIVFANNVRLSLMQTDFEANTIRVGASFGGGKLSAPADKPGIALAAQMIFADGGLEAHSIDELQQALAGRTVSANFSVGDDAFRLMGTTNDADLELQLQLLAAYLEAPGFRDEAERVVRRMIPALYAQLATTPDGVVQNEVIEFLSQDSPLFGFPTREELEARTTDDVRDWLTPALDEGFLEVAIVGDFKDAEAVVNQVANTFGALGPRAETPATYPERSHIQFPEGTDLKEFTFDSQITRAQAMVHWPTTGYEQVETVRRLSILADIVSDRMRKEIREAIGEAYSPYAFNLSSRVDTSFGFMRSIAGVEPRQTAQIISILKGIGDDLATNGISEDELVRAINPLKNQIKEWRRNNQYWLGTVCLGSFAEPRQLEWARSLGTFYDTVTVEEINGLARTYLKPESAVPVVVRPATGIQ